jgi:hypothetical protein
MVVVCHGYLPGGMTIAGNAVLLQFPPCRGINGISNLLPTHRRRVDLKPSLKPTPFHHVLQNILTHRTAANIAMAYK